MQIIIDKPELTYIDFTDLEIGVPYYCDSLSGLFVRLEDDYVLVITDNDTEPFKLLKNEDDLCAYCHSNGIDPKFLDFAETTNRSIIISLAVSI